MAITCIPNQAVNFCTPDVVSCGCYERDWCSPLDRVGNTINFQVGISEATGTNLLTAAESTFSGGCGADWTCGARWSIAANTATYGGGPGSSDLTLDLGATLEIETYYKFQYDITTGAGSATVNTQIGGYVPAAYGYPGGNTPTTTITDYFYLNAKTDDLIKFTVTQGNVDIENVKLFKLSVPDVLIKDLDGTTLYNFTKDFYLFGGATTNETSFVLNDIIPNTRCVITLWQINDFLTARIEVNPVNIGIANGCFKVYVQDEETADELISNCFDFQDSHDCTHEITWNNNSNHFGLIYALPSVGVGSGYTQTILIESRLYHPFFESEGDLYTDDGGTALQTYAKKSTVEILQTEPLPEFLHDALSNGIIHDNFFIDGVEYVKRPGDYSPDWDKNVNVAPVRIEVVKATNSDNQNRRCS